MSKWFNKLEPGKQLSNGSLLMKTRSLGDGNYIVLALMPDNPMPFVTWMASYDSRRDVWDTFWGHYYDSLEKAVEDFEEREV